MFARLLDRTGHLRVALVVQRYGREIRGGAEAHCRLIARMLAQHHDVEVLTTCAEDYERWTPSYEPGVSQDGAVQVRRFRNRPRKPRNFYRLSQQVFYDDAGLDLQEKWVRANGPVSKQLLDHLDKHGEDYDLIVFFSCRYATTLLGLPKVADRALLVPTAEDEPAIRLDVIRRVLEQTAGFLYNSHEEAQLLQSVADISGIPGVVVGVGVEIDGRRPEWKGSGAESGVGSDESDASNRGSEGDPAEEVGAPYLLYIGRIDRNKGVSLLYQHYGRYRSEGGGELKDGRTLKLALMGSGPLELPDHDDVVMLGGRPDAAKERFLGESFALVNASAYESLSMVLLEAWALSKPVFVNGRCEVMRGQCRRANGGLYFESYEDFAGCLDWMLEHDATTRKLGRQGHRYFEENYSWRVIDRKYHELFCEVLGE